MGVRKNNHGVSGGVWGHPSLTNACSRLPTAYTRSSLPLPAAAEARRWAPKARGKEAMLIAVKLGK